LVVPDKDTEQVCHGILARPRSLGIRTIRYEILVHPNRDPGCYHTAHALLAPVAREAEHALVIFDRAWDGAPSTDPEVLAGHVEEALRVMWGDRGRCVVIDPEVDVWLWGESPHVADALGWNGRLDRLRDYLGRSGVWDRDAAKPRDPKRAVDLALRKTGSVRSSAVFRRVADKVSLARCADASFGKLRGILSEWFAVG
jgi:hypothetical protein